MALRLRVRDRAADDEHLAELGRHLRVGRVGLDAERVERLRPEGAHGGREDHIHDLRIAEPEVAEPLQVGVRDLRGVVDDALGEIHDGEVDRVEAGRVAVGRDLEHRLAELLEQHLPCASEQ